MRSKWFIAAMALVLTGLQAVGLSRPVPGDVFREYMWWNEKGDAGGSLRVGGKHGDEYPDRGWAHGYINAAVILPQEFDLEHAIKAEVVVEKILHLDNRNTATLSCLKTGSKRVPHLHCCQFFNFYLHSPTAKNAVMLFLHKLQNPRPLVK